NAAIDLVAAGIAIDLPVALRVELPDLFAGRGVERVDPPRRAGRIEHAVDDDRCRLEAAARAERAIPREAEPADGFGIDLFERGVVALAEVAPRGHPLPGLAVGSEETLASDVRVRSRGLLRCLRAGCGAVCSRIGRRVVAAGAEKRARQPKRYGQTVVDAHAEPRPDRSCRFHGAPRPAAADGECNPRSGSAAHRCGCLDNLAWSALPCVGGAAEVPGSDPSLPPAGRRAARRQSPGRVSGGLGNPVGARAGGALWNRSADGAPGGGA